MCLNMVRLLPYCQMKVEFTSSSGTLRLKGGSALWKLCWYVDIFLPYGPGNQNNRLVGLQLLAQDQIQNESNQSPESNRL